MEKKTIRILAALLAAAGFSCMATACVRTIYVPTQRVSTDTLRTHREHTDTLMVRDSVYLGMRGDTLVHEVYRWRLKSRVRVDTVYRTRRDTVPMVIAPKPAPEAKTEKSKGFPAKLKSSANALIWTCRGAFIAFLIITLWTRLRPWWTRLQNLLR